MNIITVGGGASGVLLALNLLKQSGTAASITLIEKRDDLGFGFAYSTRDPAHLLNVRARNMSAFADDPTHFQRWLAAEKDRITTRLMYDDFASRVDFGHYLQSLITPLVQAGRHDGRLTLVRGECVAVAENADGISATLADRTVITGDRLVLATGNEMRASHTPSLRSPWISPLSEDARASREIAILGSGLSMIDTVISLLRAGYTGRILALSRHGLLPATHGQTPPWPIEPERIPLGQAPLACLRWLQAEVSRAEATGIDWRSVIDGLRPFVQRMWLGFSTAERRQFYIHLRPYWDVHRHRMAPSIGHEISAARASGQLEIRAGQFLNAVADGKRISFSYRPRGSTEIETRLVDRAYHCTGFGLDPSQSDAPLTRSLVEAGLVRPDPVGLGIDVDETCAVINRSGRASTRLYAMGPQTRSRFWEVTAIPDIRMQAANLAEILLASI
ncbi:MAG: FAD/NAD(P)-binding protein [Hyphomicrobiales bacterium]